jgi:hypothetical protein
LQHGAECKENDLFAQNRIPATPKTIGGYFCPAATAYFPKQRMWTTISTLIAARRSEREEKSAACPMRGAPTWHRTVCPYCAVIK